jgi:hypothetical protein
MRDAEAVWTFRRLSLPPSAVYELCYQWPIETLKPSGAMAVLQSIRIAVARSTVVPYLGFPQITVKLSKVRHGAGIGYRGTAVHSREVTTSSPR